MNHRPYPDTARALAQVKRARLPAPPSCPICFHPVTRHATDDGQPVCTRGPGLVACRDCAEAWARTPAVAVLMEFGRTVRYGTGRQMLVIEPRRAGKTAAVRAITEQAVKAGAHVHVASRGGVRCAGGAPNAASVGQPTAQARVDAAPVQPSASAAGTCPCCGHAAHAPDTECEAGVDHGPTRWHRCLCLARPGADRQCPQEMTCQGGHLGYADVWHLQRGHRLQLGGRTAVTPEIPETTPLVITRAVRTCTAVPSQWNAWTTDGQYLYLRYRSGIGTVDAYDTEDSDTWTRIPDGAVARFDTGDRLAGEMDLPEFCERAGLDLADDAEVTDR